MTDRLPISRRTALQIAAATVAATTLMPTRRAQAAHPHVVLPNDRRLGDLKDYNGYFPWQPSASVADWEKRAEYVRRQVLVATGLWPMPTKQPLNAVVHGKVERDDYTVERVILQTGDGLYCTGSLYRPKAPATGKRPAVLCPHGHWANGRFHRHSDDLFAAEKKSNAETFESGRHPLQARSVQLARMGCVVFLYDMLGVADSATPLPPGLIHGFAKQRDDMSSPDHWGLFSAQSELRCLNALGLQTWNSIRALDWISALDDVDPSRIGVTGASGGGTQTFMLGSVDSRPAAFFPAVMVSTAMQGGCTCENATYLRVGTGNIELAALIAPRPLSMSAADDWTKELETKGLPELKQHYSMLGVPENVSGKYFPFPHNYNQHARAMMYEFFNKYLNLGIQGPIVERDFVPLTIEEATVWNAQHPKPEGTPEAELRIMRGFAKDQDAQLKRLTPTDENSLKEFRRVIGGAWDVMIGRKLPGKDDFTQTNTFKNDSEDLMRFHTLVRIGAAGEEVPTLFYLPKNWNKQVAIWISDDGKDGLLNENGRPIPAVQKLIDAGISVALPDLLYQGEFLADGPLTMTRRVANTREFVGYTLGFNHPLFSQRVHDILSLVAFCRFSKYEPEGVHLIGLGKQSGALAAAAAFQAGPAVNKLAIGTGGFRFATITDARDLMLEPGAVRYGDVPGLLALSAPRPLWVSGETAIPDLVTAAYKSANAADKLSLHKGDANSAADAAAAWVIG
ncbi:MAG: acetylxylan esterase [Planctomycetes bacterium]|nr:acetylxylan esterase [Planctomycetota bacterium]